MHKRNLSMFFRAAAAVAALVCLALAAPHLRAQQDTEYRPVTDAELRDPPPGDWLMYRRTYNGWGFSPLDQITIANVADLQPAWAFATGLTDGHESPPIVNDGAMFITTPQNNVLALDARDRRHEVALRARAAGGAAADPSHQPGGGAVRRQGVHGDGRFLRRRA